MNNEKKKNKTVGWLLLIILILAILGLNYVKFFMNEENENITETPVESANDNETEITLTEITDNFNNNEEIQTLKDENITVSAINKNNSIFVSYESDTVITYEFKYNDSNLNITIENEETNLEKFKQVYKILIDAIQKHLNNANDYKKQIDEFLKDAKEYDGLTKLVENDTVTYTVNITKQLPQETEEETNANTTTEDNNKED